MHLLITNTVLLARNSTHPVTTMKPKEAQQPAAEIVRSVVNEWNPYSLLSDHVPPDEFRPEIDAIVRGLTRIQSRQDATLVVSRVFSSAFGTGRFSVDVCTEVGAKLFDRLHEAGLLVVP